MYNVVIHFQKLLLVLMHFFLSQILRITDSIQTKKKKGHLRHKGTNYKLLVHEQLSLLLDDENILEVSPSASHDLPMTLPRMQATSLVRCLLPQLLFHWEGKQVFIFLLVVDFSTRVSFFRAGTLHILFITASPAPKTKWTFVEWTYGYPSGGA